VRQGRVRQVRFTSLNDAPLPSQHKGDKFNMLWTITIVLVILWLVGLVGFPTLGMWVHILLILALISLVINLINGRRAL